MPGIRVSSSGVARPPPSDVRCTLHRSCGILPVYLVGWFLHSSAPRLVIARVYGLTNEVQKRYMTKCIGDISIS